jgi:hypothetical protein
MEGIIHRRYEFRYAKHVRLLMYYTLHDSRCDPDLIS